MRSGDVGCSMAVASMLCVYWLYQVGAEWLLCCTGL